MTSLSHLQSNACVHNWLMRVNTQYDEATPGKVKAADYDRARQSLGLGSNITNNYYLSSRPTNELNIGNTTTNNTYNIQNSPEESSNERSEEALKKKPEEEKTNWKGIAAIGIFSTVIAGISIFVYARLSKAAEGAVNYLENTKRISKWAINLSDVQNTPLQKLVHIAHIQEGIDQKAVDKITNYKYSVLTSLVGTLAMAGGGIAILSSAPALATAGTVAVVAGGILNSIAVMYAAYNCGMHWSDEKEGKKEFSEVNQLISDLITAFNPKAQTSEAPPPYDESQFIYNQRVNPNKIYPNLDGFIPSAPAYEY